MVWRISHHSSHTFLVVNSIVLIKFGAIHLKCLNCIHNDHIVHLITLQLLVVVGFFSSFFFE